MTEIVIASAARTPVGSFGGGISSLPAHELGRVAIEGALTRAGVDAAEVNEVIMGQILQAGEGQNPARQASIGAGIPRRGTGMEPEPALRFGPARGGRSVTSRSCRVMPASSSPAARKA